MIIYPAIDIKEGQVVRLRQGDPHQKTVYDSSPLTVAKRWQDQGAHVLHIVNLDGAFNQNTRLWSLVDEIAKLGLAIQLGGGLRTAEDVATALTSGVKRAVIGTAAVENPDLMSQLIAQHGAEAIVVALDARDGKVAIRGWQDKSDWSATDLGLEMAKRGVRHALYTDISRDGELGGVNIQATKDLADQTGLQVIASGGLRSIDDVKALLGSAVAGVILGKALYEGMISLPEALQLAQTA